jgi:hypothetical protein
MLKMFLFSFHGPLMFKKINKLNEASSLRLEWQVKKKKEIFANKAA